MGIAAIVLLLGVVGTLVYVLGANQRRKRDDALDGIAHSVGAIRSDDSRGAGFHCELHGVHVELRFVTRGSGSSAQSWTEIDVALPKLYPLVMNVRRHAWLDAGRITRGTMVDVLVGDPAFDDAFLVEVAPADVARVLLDAPVRRMLECHRTVELTTVGDDRPLLRLAIMGWVEDQQLARPALDQVARIGARVRDAYASVDAATSAGSEIGSPYRPIVDDRAAREAADARAVEVHAIEALRAARAARSKVFTTIAIAAIAGLIALAWLGML